MKIAAGHAWNVWPDKEPHVLPMTAPSRRETLVAVRARDASPSGGTSAQAGYDRRYLLGVVDELAAALGDVIDRSYPTHNSSCAAQPDEADCICGTGDVMDRAYALADLGPDE